MRHTGPFHALNKTLGKAFEDKILTCVSPLSGQCERSVVKDAYLERWVPSLVYDGVKKVPSRMFSSDDHVCYGMCVYTPTHTHIHPCAHKQ